VAGGFYDVQADGSTVFRCRARGRLRRDGEGLFVGDLVQFAPLHGTQGVLEKPEHRRTLLKRPAMANAEQLVIVCSSHEPPLSLQFLNRLLVLAESRCIQPVICLNKIDLPGSVEAQRLLEEVFYAAAYPLVFTSAFAGRGLQELKELLRGRISVLAGPSGAGKSSLLNRLLPGASLRTGEVSEKLQRGRHTTRQVELLPLADGGYVADTPGFSQLDLEDVDRNSLPDLFPEFRKFSLCCRFVGCRHYEEPDCAVKRAVLEGVLPAVRYEHYLVFLKEVAMQGRLR
jgi:ribosome biogenesis GTPase